MKVKSAVEKKLSIELEKRNKKQMLPHVGVIILSYFVFLEMHNLSSLSLFPYAVLILALAGRLLVKNASLVRQKLSDKVSVGIYLICVSLTGLSWGTLFTFVYEHYKLFSVETLYCLGLMLTLMSGGITTFSPSIKASAIYYTSIGILPVVTFMSDLDRPVTLLGLMFLGNTIYHFLLARMAHKYLLNALKNESLAVLQRESLQEIVDSIPALIAVVDEDENYLLVNNFFGDEFRDRILGKKIGAYLPGSEVTEALKTFLHSNQDSVVHEMGFDGFGSEEWFMVNFKRISTPEKGAIAAILPITDLVKARNDLKIHEARSQYAAKLASLGELSAGIAHEVNNPLTIIEGAANLMKVLLAETPLDTEALNKTTNKVMDTTHRIARIIKSLKMLSKDADEEPFTNVKFSSIVEPSIEISKASLRSENIKFSVIAAENDVPIFGNEIQLSQVLMNLVTNAIDAVKDVEGPKWIEIHYQTSLDWLDILVVDSGPGIEEGLRSKIMEPFFTTKESDKGTGLGLSISRTIVDNHQGFLELVDGTKNTTFRVRFPKMAVWPDTKRTHSPVKKIVVP